MKLFQITIFHENEGDVSTGRLLAAYPPTYIISTTVCKSPFNIDSLRHKLHLLKISLSLMFVSTFPQRNCTLGFHCMYIQRVCGAL
jgi:hypothetical protein